MQRSLINITYIAIMTINIEAVIQYNIMCLTSIERVIDRSEIFFKSLVRMFIRAYSIFHIMIAYSTIERKFQEIRSLDIRRKYSRCITHNITTIQNKNIAVSPFTYKLTNIFQIFHIPLNVTSFGSLYIRLYQTDMFIVIPRILNQGKIIVFHFTVYSFVIVRKTRFSLR